MKALMKSPDPAPPCDHRLDDLGRRFGPNLRAEADDRLRRRLAACRNLLIFGAGQNGAEVLRVMRRAGLEPAAFLDDTPEKIGARKDGIVIRASDAARDLDGAVAVVSVFSPTADFLPIAARLSALGLEPVSLFSFLSACGELPFYFVDSADGVTAALPDLRWLDARLADATSRDLLAAHVEFRLTLRHAVLPPWSAERLPPPADWTRFEMVDAGAFDGDTLVPLVLSHGDRLSGAVAIEPDPMTFGRLEKSLQAVQAQAGGRLKAVRAAVDRVGGQRMFANAGNPGSGFAQQGMLVDTVSIDELVESECDPDSRLYIKFDVEGAEAAALAGAARTIAERRPFLSIAAYHRPDDLWALAQQVCAMDDGYRFLLRAHGADGADLNLYGLPPDHLGGVGA
jgi:FkbM family methyltransferase